MSKKGSEGTKGPSRVGIYTRISTDEAHQPYSLGAQEDRLESYVKSQDNWKIVRKYDDQMTGTVLERPGLQRASRMPAKARSTISWSFGSIGSLAQCGAWPPFSRNWMNAVSLSGPLRSRSIRHLRPGG